MLTVYTKNRSGIFDLSAIVVSARSLFLSFTVTVLMAAGFPVFAAIENEQELTLVRAPQSSPVKLYREWKPFVDYLSQRTGAKITLKIFKNREEFEQALVGGDMDLAFTSPYYYMYLHKKHNFQPLVRSNKEKLTGIIVVQKNSKIQTLVDLKNQSIAFPSPNSFAASILIRATLENIGVLSIEPHYVGTHDNVYRHVINGNYVAGGGIMRTFNSEGEALKNNLRIVHETEGFSSHPLSAGTKVSLVLRDALIAAVLDLNHSAEGREMLRTVKLQTPVLANHELDYKKLDQMDIGRYANFRF